ncbi:hypothetical protein OAA19_03610, partial [Rubripirellula sp.]
LRDLETNSQRTTEDQSSGIIDKSTIQKHRNPPKRLTCDKNWPEVFTTRHPHESTSKKGSDQSGDGNAC